MDPRQTTLDEALAPRDPNVAAGEAPRLGRQCAAILARLNRGPATNADLAVISLKYTSRISDLRAAGFQVEAYDRDRTTGLCWYRLVTA